jgi:hypothetical protein
MLNELCCVAYGGTQVKQKESVFSLFTRNAGTEDRDIVGCKMLFCQCSGFVNFLTVAGPDPGDQLVTDPAGRFRILFGHFAAIEK